MKAAIINAYGPPSVLEVTEIERPVPGSGQVLIEVHASSVNPIDWKIRDGSMKFRFGSNFPMVLGFDIAGVVAGLGADVTGLSPGQAVVARSDSRTGAAYAEYVAVGQNSVVPKPSEISDEHAAAMPLAALTAVQGFRDNAKTKAGDNVLVIGASGGVGSYAVQIARILGATVTAVCSAPNLELAKELGADRVIDYTDRDVFETDRPYDLIYDAVAKHSFAAAAPALTRDGMYLTTHPAPNALLRIVFANRFSRRKTALVFCRPRGDAIALLTRWMVEGRLRSVIDSVFPLEDIAAAHKRSETERARGKIVIRIDK